MLQALTLANKPAPTLPREIAEALVLDIPAVYRRAALDLLRSVARQFPAGAAAMLRSLPVAYEEVGHQAVSRWTRRGLLVAADSPEAGVAYFGLHSRTSLNVLRALPTAAKLTEVQGVLSKYVHMLSGQPVTIRAAEVSPMLRPPLEEFPGENEVALPFTIDLFTTHEDNCRLYHFAAAQLAGRRDFGTYAVTLPSGFNGLLEFLRSPRHPDLLEDLFLLTEGYRVAMALARHYPGLAREQAELASRVLCLRRPQAAPERQALLDTLLAALLAGQETAQLPVWLRAIASLVRPFMEPLPAPGARADDSLRIAALLAEPLAALANGRGSLRPSDIPATPAEAVPVRASAGIAGVSSSAPVENADGISPAMPEPAAQPHLQLGTDAGRTSAKAAALSPEEILRLIESGADLRLGQSHGDGIEGPGLYITDLLGKLRPEQRDELRRMLNDSAGSDRPAPRRWLERREGGASFYYDEWDYQIGDYRQRWCRLRETAVDGDSGEFFQRTLGKYTWLIPELRRQFQRVRPEAYRTLKGLEDGEDFDLNHVVAARADLRARHSPSQRFYVARTREERDVATLFLIDMSASTDEPADKPSASASQGADGQAPAGQAAVAPAPPRRIIDITKEALVIMAEALTEIGDAYAIYGFSGHGRDNVEFFRVKSFNEALSFAVKGRIGAIEPKGSTRMGTALRHATEKLSGVNSRSRHIILLSDGFPQDCDYGQDRRSHVYGLRDTRAALREAEAAGIAPFCITVDKAGHDYLRQMCDATRYMVLDDITALPRELPRIYQRLVTA